MPATSPIKAARRTNLVALTAGPSGMGYADIARAIGKPKMRAHLSHIGSGTKAMGDKLAASIERALGLPAGWMDRPPTAAVRAAESGAAYHAAPGATATRTGLLDSVIPLLPLAALAAGSSPEIFRATLCDDALAPLHPAGTELVWSTRRRPAPGRLLLVRDEHGRVHARQSHQGEQPGQWIARPLNPAYISFRRDDPGITLLAVYKGKLEPDDA